MTDILKSIHSRRLTQPDFLPMSKEELAALGWDEIDILLVSGDAYVDHPSFGLAILGRWLVQHGFRVGVLAQPAWEGEAARCDFNRFPRPRLFAGVSSGAIDSMLAHSTAFRKKRHRDEYTPGGISGARPNRATIVYTGLVRRFFPGLPVVLGGLEASLRRTSHYDFWTDSLRRSILLDSKADVLLYGMGEKSLLDVALIAEQLLDEVSRTRKTAELGVSLPLTTNQPDVFRKRFAAAVRLVPGAVTVIRAEDLDALALPALVKLPAHEKIEQEPFALMQSTLAMENAAHQGCAFLSQESGGRNVLLAPSPTVLESRELDAVYSLPFSRLPHPAYKEPVPAWEMIRTSITTHRGCGGGCSFCSIALHQGRIISSRSGASILREAAAISSGPGAVGENKKHEPAPPKWCGSISDVGGPSANMWRAACSLSHENCVRSSCLFPKICPGFKVNQGHAVRLLRELAKLPGVRHVRVASGVRFDLALREPEALRAYTMDFTGGQLKVAPEHISADVLRRMRKPQLDVFESFMADFFANSKAAGKEQYVVPYLISAFPGCTEQHMHELKGWLKKRNWSPRQVQCFIPTPGTVATAMYYSGRDEEGMRIYVAKTDKERMRQHYILLGDTHAEAKLGVPSKKNAKAVYQGLAKDLESKPRAEVLTEKNLTGRGKMRKPSSRFSENRTGRKREEGERLQRKIGGEGCTNSGHLNRMGRNNKTPAGRRKGKKTRTAG